MAETRRMCPQCRAFITTGDRVCPYCDTPVGPRAADTRGPVEVLGGLIPAARFTTMMILLLNVGAFIATVFYSMKLGNGEALMQLDNRTLTLFGAKWVPGILSGQWWRWVTAGFLHGGLMHILMNSWVLYDLGTEVEVFFGTRRYLVIYFVSTVTGFMASTWWSGSLSIGASAGIFGLIGAMIAFGMQSRTYMGAAIKSHYGRWAVYGLLMGFLPIFRTDNAAHLGGLAGGFLIALLAGTPRLTETLRERAWFAAAVVCATATAYSFFRAVQFLLAYGS